MPAIDYHITMLFDTVVVIIITLRILDCHVRFLPQIVQLIIQAGPKKLAHFFVRVNFTSLNFI